MYEDRYYRQERGGSDDSLVVKIILTCGFLLCLMVWGLTQMAKMMADANQKELAYQQTTQDLQEQVRQANSDRDFAIQKALEAQQKAEDEHNEVVELHGEVGKLNHHIAALEGRLAILEGQPIPVTGGKAEKNILPNPNQSTDNASAYLPSLAVAAALSWLLIIALVLVILQVTHPRKAEYLIRVTQDEKRTIYRGRLGKK